MPVSPRRPLRESRRRAPTRAAPAHPQGAVDWGLLGALVLLLAVPLLAWVVWSRLHTDAPSSPPPSSSARPADAASTPSLDLDRLRRVLPQVPAEERALRDDLVRAKHQLDTLLLERVRSPEPKTWDELIADKRHEVAALEQNLQAMVSDGR